MCASSTTPRIVHQYLSYPYSEYGVYICRYARHRQPDQQAAALGQVTTHFRKHFRMPIILHRLPWTADTGINFLEQGVVPWAQD